jgi:hypothetical protein
MWSHGEFTIASLTADRADAFFLRQNQHNPDEEVKWFLHPDECADVRNLQGLALHEIVLYPGSAIKHKLAILWIWTQLIGFPDVAAGV